MFYSHEVLTDRKYGVATVWLVATLGAKSSTKRISRKKILDVDIAKACKTISTPEVPLALRLQSSLLYGVTHVYSQQCGYVLNDAESAKNNMRMMLKVVQASALDAENSNNGRSDQIALQDDPDFLPDFELQLYNLQHVDLDLGAMGSQRSILSPHDSQVMGPNNSSPQDIGSLIIPNSASSFGGGAAGGLDIFGLHGDSDAGTRMSRKAFLDDDPGFRFDEDGNLVIGDLPSQQHQQQYPASASRHGSFGQSMQSQLPQHQTGLANSIVQPDGDGFVPLQEDYAMVPPHPVSNRVEDNIPGELNYEETAQAPYRRRNNPQNKPLPLDQTMELRNGDLAHWSQHYLASMKDAIRQKNASKAAALAKQNAQHWVLGNGDDGPLSIFSGQKLLEALTSVAITTTGQKRLHDADDEAEENPRRVRSRHESSPDELGRGNQDDGFLPVWGEETVEEGREAPTPLDDRQLSSVMPWKQTTGLRGPAGLFTTGSHPTSGASLAGISATLARRGSRLTSASPLMGRGNTGSIAGELDFSVSHGSFGMTGYEQFELYGPGAQVDTQTAGQSQWQHAILDSESHHFFDFVRNEIDAKGNGGTQPSAEERDSFIQRVVDFDVLLPPSSHSRIVAAQGLLHVLTLGSKGLLSVEQSEAFGAIRLQAGDTYPC